MDNNLKKVEEFFKYDEVVKKILFDCIPCEEDRYSKETLFERGEKLYKAIDDLEYYFDKIVTLFGYDNTYKEYIKSLFNIYRNELYKCQNNYNKMCIFCDVCLSDMDNEFVAKINDTCIGYFSLFSKSDDLIKEAKTVNELLHLFHSMLINNEKVYKAMPVIKERKYDSSFSISLYGNESKIGNEIFNKFEANFNKEIIDILSLSNDKIIMMIRDRGHALVIDIDKNKDTKLYEVKYHVSKIINALMMNKLRGISGKINNNMRYAYGFYEEKEKKLVDSLVELVSKVPKKENILDKGGKLYVEHKKRR